MSFIEPLQVGPNVRICPVAPPAIERAWLGWVRRFTDTNRFAEDARSDLLLGPRRLNCGHPDLTGLDPGKMPR
jgi:hypothetical protein